MCGWLTVCARVGSERDTQHVRTQVEAEARSAPTSEEVSTLTHASKTSRGVSALGPAPSAIAQRCGPADEMAINRQADKSTRRQQHSQLAVKDSTQSSHTTHTPPRHTASGTPGSIFCGHTSFEYTAVKRLMPPSGSHQRLQRLNPTPTPGVDVRSNALPSVRSENIRTMTQSITPFCSDAAKLANSPRGGLHFPPCPPRGTSMGGAWCAVRGVCGGSECGTHHFPTECPHEEILLLCFRSPPFSPSEATRVCQLVCARVGEKELGAQEEQPRSPPSRTNTGGAPLHATRLLRHSGSTRRSHIVHAPSTLLSPWTPCQAQTCVSNTLRVALQRLLLSCVACSAPRLPQHYPVAVSCAVLTRCMHVTGIESRC
jgi:hypothetical protein